MAVDVDVLGINVDDAEAANCGMVAAGAALNGEGWTFREDEELAGGSRFSSLWSISYLSRIL